ncbi:hypothetical protein NPIL_619171 [Nephila pilipes]|uniref:Uncharacterized protein n=1 Tax=Nephila pilipes TaxID=299642 RepID=A0A8X6PZ12_NEPPI|nr:hypothetical protein NPIL_619171 [Nephila pilipes]
MPYTLLLLIFGICVIYIETTVLGLRIVEMSKMEKEACGFNLLCTEDQCCVGNKIEGYCVDNPAEGNVYVSDFCN